MEIVLDRVGYAAGDLPVLESISLGVGSGEIVAVLGPSGCGKSTLLRLVGGMASPTSGRVLLRGAAPASSLNPVTTVFQDPTLLPWRTVAGNVVLPLEHTCLPRTEIRHRCAAMLERVGLAQFAQFYPKQLSGGMRQRVSLARALVVEPAVLLMDEPFSALDAGMRALLHADLVRVWADSAFTGLYVTHSVAEAVRIGHRVVVLSARPASIRAVIAIETPLTERSETHPAVVLARERVSAWVDAPEAVDPPEFLVDA